MELKWSTKIKCKLHGGYEFRKSHLKERKLIIDTMKFVVKKRERKRERNMYGDWSGLLKLDLK